MRLLDYIVWLFTPIRHIGGGGGGGSTQFKAQGSPPGFDYQNASALNQLAIGGDIQGYALSDADFANRYPALQNAYNKWQANLGQQTSAVGAGTAGQQNIMSQLANTIAGRNATGTTTDINALRGAGATVGSAVNPIFGLGSQQAAIGGNINQLGGQVAGMAATPYALGQQLLREPIDPQVQQQMMLAGLGSTAGALGGANLGQGMAGQAAAARQLGLNTLQYGQAMRGEAMGDISQAASIAGQGGQLQGLGAQTIGAGAQTYGLGAQTAATAGGLYGQAQGLQEQYGMDTAQMANIYGTLQNQQAQNLMLNMQTAGQLFQKRPFGLGGTNLAQSELGQAGAYNSFQQANYATMNGIAFNQAQMNAQQQQLAAQQSAGMVSAGVGAAGAVASAAAAAAAISCWVARACFSEEDPRWLMFRTWLYSKRCPLPLRALYLRFGQRLAAQLGKSEWLRRLIKKAMNRVIYDRRLIANALGTRSFQLILGWETLL
jgi:hypothetical protein